MGKKLVQLTEEQQKLRDNEDFLKGRPNRMEVANYVNSLWESVYSPKIEQQFDISHQSMQIGLMVVQSILIKNNLCTEDEIKSITEEFIRLKQEHDEKEEENKN